MPPRLAAWWSAWRRSILTGLVAVSVFRLATVLVGAAVSGGRGWPLRLYDENWWAGIAQHGYGTDHFGAFSDGAFAPAYPMAMRAVMWLFHIGAYGAGFVVSSASLLVAAVVLHRLVDEDQGQRAAATTLLLLLVWPTAVFLALSYSEPFSLALVALALLAARRERWGWAGALAALAMLSKYVLGVLVLALVVDHLVRQRRRGQPVRPRALLAITLPAALALVGVMLFMRARFGDPLFFLAAEGRAWGHRLAAPWQLAAGTRNELADMVARGGFAAARTAALDALTIAGLAVAAVAMLVRRWRHPAETALVAGLAAAFLCMSEPDSVGRYALAAAPLFIVLGPALARRPLLRAPVLGVFAGIMALQFVTFATGGWAG